MMSNQASVSGPDAYTDLLGHPTVFLSVLLSGFSIPDIDITDLSHTYVWRMVVFEFDLADPLCTSTSCKSTAALVIVINGSGSHPPIQSCQCPHCFLSCALLASVIVSRYFTTLPLRESVAR